MGETRILSAEDSQAYSTGVERGRASERESCADLVANITMQELLLAMGEMTTQEKRTCKALQGFLAHKIRTRND